MKTPWGCFKSLIVFFTVCGKLKKINKNKNNYRPWGKHLKKRLKSFFMRKFSWGGKEENVTQKRMENTFFPLSKKKVENKKKYSSAKDVRRKNNWKLRIISNLKTISRGKYAKQKKQTPFFLLQKKNLIFTSHFYPHSNIRVWFSSQKKPWMQLTEYFTNFTITM